MASRRWLSIPVVVLFTAAPFAACSSGGTTTGTTSTSGSSSASAGGAGGTSEATTTSAGTGGVPDAGEPLSCKGHTYSTIKDGPCDLLLQNCPDGKTCKELQNNDGSWTTTHCVAANGLKGEGEKCGVDEECQAKLFCAAGRCAPVCCAATNAPCLGGICNLFIQLDQSNTASKEVCHYAKACAVLTANACEQGFSCHLEDSKQGAATCVQPSGKNAPDLGPCEFLNDCGDMEHCVGGKPGSPGTCHFYCDLTQTTPASPGPGLGGCPTGQVCQSKVDGVVVPLGVPDLGLCGQG